MTETDKPFPQETDLCAYQIRVKGYPDPAWMDWFEQTTITPEVEGITLIFTPGMDQAALFGMLKRIRDLGLVLVSINNVNYYASKNDCHS